MRYLEGERVDINTKTLKSLKGTKVRYLLERDIDKSGRGYFFPRSGVVGGSVQQTNRIW